MLPVCAQVVIMLVWESNTYITLSVCACGSASTNTGEAKKIPVEVIGYLYYSHCIQKVRFLTRTTFPLKKQNKKLQTTK